MCLLVEVRERCVPIGGGKGVMCAYWWRGGSDVCLLVEVRERCVPIGGGEGEMWAYWWR